MAKNRDYIWEINRKVLINSPVSKVWDIISSESHLEKFHPFCKKNEVKEWVSDSHKDTVAYYNSRILHRDFYHWLEGEGFDLIIGDSRGNDSHVSWRLSNKDSKTLASITIKPYIYNKGSKFINFIPFFAFVRPKLANYLYSVLMGLKFYTENDEIVSKDQFGSHSLFS